MPLPSRLARFNRAFTNHITRPFAAYLPGFSVVVHRGRRTGTEYRTPVNTFRRGDGYLLVLTYSSHTDWVANVCAAGTFELVHLGKRVAVSEPRLLAGIDATQLYPRLLRPLLRALKVDEAMLVSRAAEGSA
jgi:deazaflavin-dependent oxidoreductase (nitroreductase family)